MYNDVEKIIDELKEDCYELYHKNRTVKERKQLLELMLYDIDKLKIELEKEVDNLKELF